MPLDDAGSVTHWIGDLKAGGDVAAQNLWERYFDKLVHLARNKLRTARRSAVEDEEDAALSAFDSFCRGATVGRFPRLNDRDDLWRLLVVLTVRKAYDQVERANAKKLGGPGKPRPRQPGAEAAPGTGQAPGNSPPAGENPWPKFQARVLSESMLRTPDGGGGLDYLAGPEPTPEFAAMVADEYLHLRKSLGDETVRQVLDLRLEGYGREEIAARLNCAERTVTRKLDLIRQTWLGEGG
jgi:hypothetical protein